MGPRDDDLEVAEDLYYGHLGQEDLELPEPEPGVPACYEDMQPDETGYSVLPLSRVVPLSRKVYRSPADACARFDELRRKNNWRVLEGPYTTACYYCWRIEVPEGERRNSPGDDIKRSG